MRERDKEEIQAGWGMDPIMAMRNCLTASVYARTAFVGLVPLCMYGVAPLSIISYSSARLWMFSTRAIDSNAFAFTRASRREIPNLLQYAPVLTNLVDVTDNHAVRWLDWLGASYVLKSQERGGRMFAQFVLTASKIKPRHICQQG